MKTFFKITIAFVFTISALFVSAQTVNWKRVNPGQKHIFNVNAGFDYGMSYSAVYGYTLNTKWPAILNVGYSMPAGDRISDDSKSKVGGQVRVYEWNNIQFTARIEGIFRRYQNNLVRMHNFGSDFAAIIGYYKPKYFVAAEAGFDKAIVTHIKGSPVMKDNFPAFRDGWYQPSTGGNFYYGLQLGYSFPRFDIHAKAGKILTQDFRTTPTLPLYGQVGFNYRFN